MRTCKRGGGGSCIGHGPKAPKAQPCTTEEGGGITSLYGDRLQD